MFEGCWPRGADLDGHRWGLAVGRIQKLQPGEENYGTFNIFYISKISEFETFHIWCPIDKMGKRFLNRFSAGRGVQWNSSGAEPGRWWPWRLGEIFLRFRSARGRPGAPAGSGFMILLPKSFQILPAGSKAYRFYWIFIEIL